MTAWERWSADDRARASALLAELRPWLGMTGALGVVATAAGLVLAPGASGWLAWLVSDARQPSTPLLLTLGWLSPVCLLGLGTLRNLRAWAAARALGGDPSDARLEVAIQRQASARGMLADTMVVTVVLVSALLAAAAAVVVLTPMP